MPPFTARRTVLVVCAVAVAALAGCSAQGDTTATVPSTDPAPANVTPAKPPVQSPTPDTAAVIPDTDNPYGLEFFDNGVPKAMPVRTGIVMIDDALTLGTDGYQVVENPTVDMPGRDEPIEMSASIADALGLPPSLPTAQVNVTVGDKLLLPPAATKTAHEQYPGAVNPKGVTVDEYIQTVLQPSSWKNDDEIIAVSARQRVRGGGVWQAGAPGVVYLCHVDPDTFEGPCQAVTKVVVAPKN